ncbi:glycine N-acyltransferase-like protein 2 [Sarcophilus harrisii]|uniref:glycine N-acyltransferase-like protein 2 n=1 Tax=Sarcophilus harrisii TaxID=9305 RepID=UPI000273C8CB|nr:glycine N-acyltransferase-like protein 2 [Sarcophilus harrisii]
MIRLHEAKMLQTLHRSLTQNIPEAIKVYGAIFHINRGNPFNLEVLVDSWPDYQTVITRPQKQEMMDDKDRYTNTYHIFSKNLQKLPEILESDSVINWKQSLTIQGCQKGLDEKIRDAVASKSVQVNYNKRFLYITDNVFKSITSNASKLMKPLKVASSENVKFISTNNNFRPSLLSVFHAELINNNWKFGQNEKSLRFVKRCLQNFPGQCVLDSEGNPISWIILEHTSEMRMSYSLPEYQCRGFAKWVMNNFMEYLQKNDTIFYGQVEEMNEAGHKFLKSVGFSAFACGGYEWECIPADLI